MIRNKWTLALCVLTIALNACIKDHNPQPVTSENAAAFREVSSTDLGGEAAAEISAYDAATKRLFTVNNESKALVDVLDFSSFPAKKIQSIDISALGGVANSVAVSDGKLAIALEGADKQANGKIIVINTSTLAEIKQVTVGALPDMVTFSPDGKYIVTANEGEPNATYTNDPEGSISIIDVTNNYSVKTINFTAFASMQSQLLAGGFRTFGPNAGDFSKDIEPEYVAISEDSKKAWVTLQENNAIAEVDLVSGTILKINPLGTKDYSVVMNAIDASNEDGKIELKTWPVKSYYMPDAISYFNIGGTGYLITANEGDARDYTGFKEEARVSTLKLDPVKFPNAAELQKKENLGRLNVTTTAGKNSAGLYEELYGFGGHGFSIFNASTGQQIFEIGKALEEEVIKAGKYDDSRSDDKGIEPEGVTVGLVNGKPTAFVALERADAIAVYDVSNPTAPKFLQLIATGDAPEGVLFVSADKSPNGRSMLVVSSEGDGTVKVYQPDLL